MSFSSLEIYKPKLDDHLPEMPGVRSDAFSRLLLILRAYNSTRQGILKFFTLQMKKGRGAVWETNMH